MDRVLEEATRMSCLLRQTPEAVIWRTAVGTLSQLPIPSAGLSRDASALDIVAVIGHANRVRPLLTTLLSAKYRGDKPRSLFEGELKQHREVWQAHQQLEGCASFIGTLITFLRSLAPGYPHDSLVFTLPESGWFQLTSRKELPWSLGGASVKGNEVTAQDLGLERLLPMSAPFIIESIEKVANAIRQHEVYTSLRRAYSTIGRNHNLQAELGRAKAEFARRTSELQQARLTVPEYVERADIISKDIYQRRGKRIKSYVDSFLEYEWLLERIYWQISQIAHHTHISAISTENPRQLQQVAFTPDSPDRLTGLAKGRPLTLAAGQLLHVTLAEADHLADGLYQVEYFKQYYTPSRGFHIALRTRRLWGCSLSELKEASDELADDVMLEHEGDVDPADSMEMRIYDGAEAVAVFPLGHLLGHTLTETMYLP